ncbi:MAG TPA: alpha/beta hydrolase [Allosphingosinicella sp.]
MIGKLIKGLVKALAGLLLLAILVLAGFRIAASVRETETAVPSGLRSVATPLGAVTVEVAGPADGPPVMIVPGTAGWSGFWRNVTRHLAAKGWRVIAVDLPPFGFSERDPRARYGRRDQAARLAAVLAAEARSPAVVIGHSFGGGPATELALLAPGRVRSLVLVDAALGTLDPAPAGRWSADRIVRPAWVAEPVVSASLTNPLAIGTLMRSMLARRDAADPWIETIRLPMRRSGTTAGYADWLPFLLTADDGAASRRSAGLARIRVPVALIWGEADTVTPIAQGETIARLTRARSLIRLPGVGHVPHIEDEPAFLRALDAAMGAAQ